MPRDYSALKNEEERLDKIASFLEEHIPVIKNDGLFHGSMGIVLYFCHYALYKKSDYYDNLASELFMKIMSGLNHVKVVTFMDGVCGFGWAMAYLQSYGFINDNIEPYYSKIDHMVIERDLSRMKDTSFSEGIGGILAYVIVRLNILSQTKNNKNNIFDQSYIRKLKKAAKRVLEVEQDWRCRNYAIQILTYNENKKDEVLPLDINHIITTIPDDIPHNAAYWDVSMKTVIGYGIILSEKIKKMQEYGI